MSVETHDINAAPAFVVAFARPERTSKPRVAIVAVLDTKPDAKEESNRAFFDDKAVLQYVRALAQIKQSQ